MPETNLLLPNMTVTPNLARNCNSAECAVVVHGPRSYPPGCEKTCGAYPISRNGAPKPFQYRIRRVAASMLPMVIVWGKAGFAAEGLREMAGIEDAKGGTGRGDLRSFLRRGRAPKGFGVKGLRRTVGRGGTGNSTRAGAYFARTLRRPSYPRHYRKLFTYR
jgi:hypothetical protein